MATTTLSRKIGNQTLTFESGKMARLADGAVMVTYGETQVLGTCVSSNPREGIDFFPLTIDVEERMYAIGKIPGSFFRREGRPSETAVLTCRLIDRPLRPTFRDGYRDEVQVVITVLGMDGENPYDVVGDERGVRGHVPGRSAVRRPGRLRPHGPDRRPVGHEPHVPADRGGDVRRRRRRSPQRVRRDRHPDDRGRGARQHVGPARRRRHRADGGDGRRGPRGRQGRDRRGDRVPAGVR